MAHGIDAAGSTPRSNRQAHASRCPFRASVRHAAQETERVQAIAEQLLLLARVDEPAATAPAEVEPPCTSMVLPL